MMMIGMLFRMLRREARRNAIVMLVVFAMVAISAFLSASGAGLIVELVSSLNALFERSVAPHVVQMHSGEFNEREIERWARSQPLVDRYQIAEMIAVDGSQLFLGEGSSGENGGVMDISFVVQNKEFDFLLDHENRPMRPKPGEIGVPMYYRHTRDLAVGDAVTVELGQFTRRFKIAGFVRDAQMNPSVVHSKRFLVHPSDYAALQAHLPEREYLIEFRLTDLEKTDEFIAAYIEAGLPDRGLMVDHRLFKLLNAVTDGVVAAVTIVLSLLLICIAVLCLRFTIVASIEEDLREIGVMKAIGMSRRRIGAMYLAKYLALSALAALLGYAASVAARPALTAEIALFLGSADKSPVLQAIPPTAAATICVLVTGSSAVVLRRIRRISPVAALRSGDAERPPGRAFAPALRIGRRSGVNVVLGLRDLAQRPKLYEAIAGIFAVCSTIILIPFHFHSTMNDPSLITYMGIGRSDIRVDLRRSDLVGTRFDDMIATVAADPEIERFSPRVTARFRLVQEDHDSIAVEAGDFSRFPPAFFKGAAPVGDNEIALSYLNARDLEVQLGDTITLLVNAEERILSISGIYQDVTHGGRTAKASIPYDDDAVLWYTLIADVTAGTDVAAKVGEYSRLFHPARVTDLDGYIEETLGHTILQLGGVARAAVIIALVVATLITSLFLKMLLTKDASRIAIMKSLGFSLRHVRLQYQTTALLLTAVGVTAGTMFANTLGQRLVGVLWTLMGAAQLEFVIRPLQAYLLFPLLLAGVVSLTTALGIRHVKNTTIATTIFE